MVTLENKRQRKIEIEVWDLLTSATKSVYIGIGKDRVRMWENGVAMVGYEAGFFAW